MSFSTPHSLTRPIADLPFRRFAHSPVRPFASFAIRRASFSRAGGAGCNPFDMLPEIGIFAF